MTLVRKTLMAGAGLLATLAVAGAAAATTYDAVADFSSANPSGPWSYGTGDTGTSFTPYTSYLTDDFATGISGWSLSGAGTVPVILKNFTSATIDFQTVVFPNDVLLIHPGQSTDSIIRFTAPTTGEYKITGLAETLDVSPYGDPSGVKLIGYTSSGAHGSIDLPGAPPASFPDTPGQQYDYSRTLFLNAGDWIELGVNNNGSYYNDSTGIAFSISTVPEPAAWALMLVGFGALGGALRARRGQAASAV